MQELHKLLVTEGEALREGKQIDDRGNDDEEGEEEEEEEGEDDDVTADGWGW